MLYDDIIANKVSLETTGQWSSSDLRDGYLMETMQLIRSPHIVRINAQNVADYYWMGTDQEHWHLEDFPNTAPPWELTWFEFNFPPYSRSKDLGIVPMKDRGDGMIHRKGGAIFYAEKINDKLLERLENRIENIRWREAKWLIQCIPFRYCTIKLNGSDTFFISHLIGYWGVNERGEIVLYDKHKGMHFFCRNLSPSPEFDKEILRGLYMPSIEACLLAHSFIHCRNVELVRVESKRKNPKKKKGKLQKALHDYYTLKIDPIKKILDDTQKTEGVSLGKALHIRRGHFKDYTQRGLFGKHKGIYWWEQKLLGSESKGKIDKGYEI